VLQQVTEELIEPEKWFIQEIIARGSQIIVKINGKTVVDKKDAPIAKGRVGILSNKAVGTIWVKKIEIKELPPPAKTKPDEISDDMKAILKGLTDSDAGVRGDTARSLEKLGDKSAVPALMKRLEDDNFGWTKWYSKRRNNVASCKDLAFDALV